MTATAAAQQIQEETEGMAHPYSGPDAAKKFEKMKKRARARFEKYKKDWADELTPDDDDDSFVDSEMDAVNNNKSPWNKAQIRDNDKK